MDQIRQEMSKQTNDKICLLSTKKKENYLDICLQNLSI